ncbi:MAG: cytochrome c-type biogenesis protein CcmH [Alphaproteobacteria bacterium]|nr:MAG: cytochrome c-type biogenesis protein CcmH [Alphaproteobacteria bacterium]
MFLKQSLRGAKRRGNPAGLGGRAGLLRFARNDVVLALALLWAAPALADSALPPAALADTQLPDPRQERQARALMEEIRCLVCQGQSIADSNAEMAGDMRALIRSRIQRGESAESIRAWLIARYGDWVSYDPPLEPVTWPLWALPALLILAGLWLARGRFRRRAR